MVKRLLLIVMITSLLYSYIPSYAQTSNYVSYVMLSPSTHTWIYNNNTIIAYNKDMSGITKVIGPATFQNSVTTSQVQSLWSDPVVQGGCYPYDPIWTTSWQNEWNNTVSNTNNWYFSDKYIVIPFAWDFKGQNETGDNYAICAYFIDLENLSVAKHTHVFRYNTSGYSISINNVIQLTNPVVIVDFRITDVSPDECTFYAYFPINPTNGNVISIYGDECAKLSSNIPFMSGDSFLFSVYAQCLSTEISDIRKTFIIAINSVSQVYSSIGDCNNPATPDPVLSSITFVNRSAGSMYVTQSNNNYICRSNESALQTINYFADCLQVSAFPTAYNNLYISSPIQHYSLDNSTIPYTLFFNATSNKFSKAEYTVNIANKILNIVDNVLLDTNVNFTLVNLYAERGGNTYVNDVNALQSPNSKYFIRVSVFDPNTNTTTTNNYEVLKMNLTNKLEVNTIMNYFNPANDNNTKIYLVWQVNINNTTYERVFELQKLVSLQLSVAVIDMSQNLTLAEETVVFTDTNLNNTLMLVKAMGSSTLIDQKTTSPDRIKFLAVEGNCYTINKMNQALTFLANVCAVSPFQTTIGPSDGQQGNLLIGIYWFPQWWVNHIYYSNNNTVDVIIHKTPPFNYRIVINDKSSNTNIHDTNWQVSNNDPLTRNFALGNSDVYTIIVYGKDSNTERVVYTADIIKNKDLSSQFFLPFTYQGVNVILIMVIASMLMWTKNNASVGAVITVVCLAILNWLGLLKISESLFMLIVFLAGIAIIISKRIFG